MTLKVRQNKQIDLILLCCAVSAPIAFSQIGTVTAEWFQKEKSPQPHNWEEEALMAQGHKLSLRSASPSGLQLIEGVGDTLATAIVSSRSKILSVCDGVSPTTGVAKHHRKRNGDDAKSTVHESSLDEKALDSVPGIGAVRSKIISEDITVCW